MKLGVWGVCVCRIAQGRKASDFHSPILLSFIQGMVLIISLFEFSVLDRLGFGDFIKEELFWLIEIRVHEIKLNWGILVACYWKWLYSDYICKNVCINLVWCKMMCWTCNWMKSVNTHEIISWLVLWSVLKRIKHAFVERFMWWVLNKSCRFMCLVYFPTGITKKYWVELEIYIFEATMVKAEFLSENESHLWNFNSLFLEVQDMKIFVNHIWCVVMLK